MCEAPAMWLYRENQAEEWALGPGSVGTHRAVAILWKR